LFLQESEVIEVGPAVDEAEPCCGVVEGEVIVKVVAEIGSEPGRARENQAPKK